MKEITDLTVEQYMYINLLIDMYKDNESKLNTEIIKYMHGNLEIQKRQADATLRSITKLISEPPNLINRFEFNGVEYGFIPNLDTITMGEFADLETYMNEESKQLHKIAAILYRPIIKKKDKLYQIEKYKGTQKYAEVFKNVSFKTVIGAANFFFYFKVEFVKSFEFVYKERDEEFEDDIPNLKNFSEEKIFATRFGWQPMFDAVGQNQFLSTNDVVKMEAREFLHILNYLKEKNRLEEARIKKSYRS